MRKVNGRWRASHAGEQIYVLVNPAWPDFVKIGHTIANPSARLSSYNTGCPLKAYRFAAVVVVENAKSAEAKIHAALSESRVKGEWFRISPEKAIAFVQSLAVPKPIH